MFPVDFMSLSKGGGLEGATQKALMAIEELLPIMPFPPGVLRWLSHHLSVDRDVDSVDSVDCHTYK